MPGRYGTPWARSGKYPCVSSGRNEPGWFGGIGGRKGERRAMETIGAEQFERLLRRVVREELGALLGTSGPPPSLPMMDGWALAREANPNHPFLLSERELNQAESLLAAEERPILRHRVYAARFEKAGNRKAAERERSKANRLENALSGVESI